MGHTQLCSRNTPVFLLKVIPGGARFNYWDMEKKCFSRMTGKHSAETQVENKERGLGLCWVKDWEDFQMNRF